MFQNALPFGSTFVHFRFSKLFWFVKWYLFIKNEHSSGTFPENYLTDNETKPFILEYVYR